MEFVHVMLTIKEILKIKIMGKIGKINSDVSEFTRIKRKIIKVYRELNWYKYVDLRKKYSVKLSKLQRE